MKKKKKDKPKDKKAIETVQKEKSNNAPPKNNKDTIGQKIYLYVMKD